MTFKQLYASLQTFPALESTFLGFEYNTSLRNGHTFIDNLVDEIKNGFFYNNNEFNNVYGATSKTVTYFPLGSTR